MKNYDQKTLKTGFIILKALCGDLINRSYSNFSMPLSKKGVILITWYVGTIMVQASMLQKTMTDED